MLAGFEQRHLDVDGVTINVRVGGSGPPVLLLHGYPQTGAMWHRVAPVLTRTHTVVVPDLRGYGDSAAPPAGPDSAAYSKRAMAADQVAVMADLGFERFAVVGHDRGARVAHRMCLDHPSAVERAAVLDIVPTRHAFAATDQLLATVYYHWFFLIQPSGHPERLIGADPEYWIRYHLDAWSRVPDSFDADAVAEYVRCFDPDSIAATCADYRAGAGIDLEHDGADAGRRVECPLLVMWGSRGFVGARYDVPAVWREYAGDVRGIALDCGHFLPEEAPDATASAIAQFLG
jgi:haloacetate dehalogenase